VIEDTSREHAMLRTIVWDNIAKNVYDSIHGMAFSNYKKYFQKRVLGPEDEAKKLKQIGRVIMFGIRILMGQGIIFVPYDIKSRYNVTGLIDMLEKAYERSELPDKPADEPFDEFLLNLRFNRLEFLKEYYYIGYE
jgi:hypothetical protein